MQDPKTIIKNIFKEIFEPAVYSVTAVQKYIDPAYVQEVDGKILYFKEFCQHVEVQKSHIATISFDFRTMISEGDIVFSNHIVSATTADGRSGQVRVIAEFRLKDGKLISCNELTHMISGDEKDRDLGSRH